MILSHARQLIAVLCPSTRLSTFFCMVDMEGRRDCGSRHRWYYRGTRRDGAGTWKPGRRQCSGRSRSDRVRPGRRSRDRDRSFTRSKGRSRSSRNRSSRSRSRSCRDRPLRLVQRPRLWSSPSPSPFSPSPSPGPTQKPKPSLHSPSLAPQRPPTSRRLRESPPPLSVPQGASSCCCPTPPSSLKPSATAARPALVPMPPPYPPPQWHPPSFSVPSAAAAPVPGAARAWVPTPVPDPVLPAALVSLLSEAAELASPGAVRALLPVPAPLASLLSEAAALASPGAVRALLPVRVPALVPSAAVAPLESGAPLGASKPLESVAYAYTATFADSGVLKPTFGARQRHARVVAPLDLKRVCNGHGAGSWCSAETSGNLSEVGKVFLIGRLQICPGLQCLIFLLRAEAQSRFILDSRTHSRILLVISRQGIQLSSLGCAN